MNDSQATNDPPLAAVTGSPRACEEKRIMIAEACGWKHIEGEEPCYGGGYKQACWRRPDGICISSRWDYKSAFGLPEYFDDLNAMHEAEKVLTDDQCRIFRLRLQWLNRDAVSGPGSWCFHATAAHRADAFLFAANAEVSDRPS